MSNVKTVDRDEWGVRGIKDRAVVSSRMVAEIFGRPHNDVLKAIRKSTNDLSEVAGDFLLANFTENTFTNRGKKYPEFILTKDGFTYIAMGFTGKDAAKYKVEYITRFNAMEEFMDNRIGAKAEHKELMSTLEDSGASYWDYSNESDMLNIIVLGMKAKAYRESQGITDKETRAYLTAEQIYCISKLQKMDNALIEMNRTFAERKEELTKYYLTKLLPKVTKLIE